MQEQAVQVLNQRLEYDLHLASLRSATPRERPAGAGLMADEG